MKIKVVKGYTFVNANGVPLHLSLGLITEGLKDEHPVNGKDQGFRWMFEGREIPMPVRSGYWFNGMPEHIMLDWLKGNGWALRIMVNTNSGRAHIYELPFYDEPSKGNEKQYELPECAIASGERALNRAVNLLYNAGNKLYAISLYRVVHPCTLSEANYEVDKILAGN